MNLNIDIPITNHIPNTEEPDEQLYDEDFIEENEYDYDKYIDDIQNITVDIILKLKDVIHKDALPIAQQLNTKDIYNWIEDNKLIELKKYDKFDSDDEYNDQEDLVVE